MHKFKVTDKSGNQYIACEDNTEEVVLDAKADEEEVKEEESVEKVEESEEVETKTDEAEATEEVEEVEAEESDKDEDEKADETEEVEEVEEVEEETEEDKSTVGLTEDEILALKDLAACAPALMKLLSGEDLNADKSDDINEVDFFNANEEVIDNGESEEDDIIEDSEDDNYLEDSNASFGSVESYNDSSEDELKAQQEICDAWEKWLNNRN